MLIWEVRYKLAPLLTVAPSLVLVVDDRRSEGASDGEEDEPVS